jgi:hypothetical protein
MKTGPVPVGLTPHGQAGSKPLGRFAARVTDLSRKPVTIELGPDPRDIGPKIQGYAATFNAEQ